MIEDLVQNYKVLLEATVLLHSYLSQSSGRHLFKYY